MIACTGRLAGFSATPYDMRDSGGGEGISRSCAISDGGKVDVIKFTQQCWENLPPETQAILEGDPESHPDYRITARLNSACKFSDPSMFLLEPYKRGLHLSLIEGQEPAVPTGASKRSAA